MLSDHSSVSDSNRAEADGAGRLEDGSALAAFRGHFLHNLITDPNFHFEIKFPM